MAQPEQPTLRPNPRNPRRITKKKLAMLRESMAYYGDLSGIVLNTADGRLVGGHQRLQAYSQEQAPKVTYLRRHDPPLPNGTTAEGTIELAGSRFAYREVSWPTSKAQAASLSANKEAGTWALEEVSQLLGELQGSEYGDAPTMFDDQEKASLFRDVDEAPPMDEQPPSQASAAIECPACGHEFYRGKQ